MIVYRITHTIERFLSIGKREVKRHFSDLNIANSIYESLSSYLNYGNDEWISLEAIDIVNVNGEFIEHSKSTLRYLSDDTKIGVDFRI